MISAAAPFRSVARADCDSRAKKKPTATIDGNVPGFSLIAENGGLIPNGIGSLFAITLGVVFAFAYDPGAAGKR